MKTSRLLFTLAVFSAILVIGGCALFQSGLSTEEKAVLVDKAISGAGTTSTSSDSPVRTVAGGTVNVTIGNDSDFSGSQFSSEVTGSTFYSITYSSVSVKVQDEDGNDVTVVLNGTTNYAYKLQTDGTNYTYTFYFYGNVHGTVDGEAYNFEIDLKTVITADGTQYSVTITGTAGGCSK